MKYASICVDPSFPLPFPSSAIQVLPSVALRDGDAFLSDKSESRSAAALPLFLSAASKEAESGFHTRPLARARLTVLAAVRAKEGGGWANGRAGRGWSHGRGRSVGGAIVVVGWSGTWAEGILLRPAPLNNEWFKTPETDT